MIVYNGIAAVAACVELLSRILGCWSEALVHIQIVKQYFLLSPAVVLCGSGFVIFVCIFPCSLCIYMPSVPWILSCCLKRVCLLACSLYTHLVVFRYIFAVSSFLCLFACSSFPVAGEASDVHLA